MLLLIDPGFLACAVIVDGPQPHNWNGVPGYVAGALAGTRGNAYWPVTEYIKDATVTGTVPLGRLNATSKACVLCCCRNSITGVERICAHCDAFGALIIVTRLACCIDWPLLKRYRAMCDPSGTLAVSRAFIDQPLPTWSVRTSTKELPSGEIPTSLPQSSLSHALPSQRYEICNWMSHAEPRNPPFSTSSDE